MGEIVKVKVSLVFFAKSRELVGQKEVQLQVPSACSGRQLLNHIVLAYPELLRTMDHVDLVFDKLKVDEITDLVSAESCGAISLFVGTTRDNFEDKRVLHLEYEAYDSMAKKKMLEVCLAIREKWDVHNIAIIHRIGVVPVKEASIVIAISSSHRKESLEAVQYAIETVKAVVPVWKKELYEDETFTWKQNKECCWSGDKPTPDRAFSS